VIYKRGSRPIGIGRGDKRQRRECAPQREGKIGCKRRVATLPQERLRLALSYQRTSTPQSILLEDRPQTTIIEHLSTRDHRTRRDHPMRISHLAREDRGWETREDLQAIEEDCCAREGTKAEEDRWGRKGAARYARGEGRCARDSAREKCRCARKGARDCCAR